jgi:predicted TPR repeat methyltransferase
VEELNYNGFHRMRRKFDSVMLKEKGENHKFNVVVDAGCGTGLAGVEFRNISSTLIGIDISRRIIEQAKKSHNVYDEYKVGDFTEVLRQFPHTVSLLVAADSFIYFNDLGELFAAIEGALEDGGYAVFSLENVSNDNELRLSTLKPDWRWQITSSGRIAHRKKYVEAAATENSLHVALYEKLDGFREENGVEVPGHFFVLKKRSSNDEL